MARQKVVNSDGESKTTEQQAKEFAAGIESVNQSLAWMGGFDRELVVKASIEAGNWEAIKDKPDGDLSLAEAQAVIVVLRRWQLEGKLNGSVPEAAGMAEDPATPLTEVEQLREQIKKYQQVEEERAARQKKMAKCLNRIDRAEQAVRTAEAELEGAKGAVKEAHAERDHALNELKMTAKGLPIQMELLDPAYVKSETIVAAQEGGGSDATVASSPSAPASEEWKAVRLDTLDIPAGTIKKLAEHEPRIETLGDLTAWQAAKGEFWSKDIPGIGPGAAEKIANACDKYWVEHPRTTVEEKAPEESPAEVLASA